MAMKLNSFYKGMIFSFFFFPLGALDSGNRGNGHLMIKFIDHCNSLNGNGFSFCHILFQISQIFIRNKDLCHNGIGTIGYG